jgi:hypothetical protein
MLNYRQLKENRKEFLSATGLYPEEYDRLLIVLKEKYTARMAARRKKESHSNAK